MTDDAWLPAEEGQAHAGIARMPQRVMALEQVGTEMDRPWYLGLLAEA